MGGYGSGRRSDKPKIEECNSIDANQLKEMDALRTAGTGQCTGHAMG